MSSVAIATATASEVPLPLTVNPPDPKRFFDSGSEYDLNAGKMGEKQATGKYVAQKAIGVAEAFSASAAPGETFNYFEAGLGNGIALAAVIEKIHAVHPEIGISVTAKEFSGHHVQVGLHNLADIFEQQRDFSFAVTNGLWADAPTLRPEAQKEGKPAKHQIVHEVKLKGTTAQEFHAQFAQLKDLITLNWETAINDKGLETPVHQAVLIVSREDRNPELRPVPQVNAPREYHVASVMHAWRLAGKDELKANILAPLARALKPDIGRVFVSQAAGNNSAAEIVDNVFQKNPFKGWSGIQQATQAKLGDVASQIRFNQGERIELQSSEVTPHEAFRIAVYASQISVEEAEQALENGALNETALVLEKNNGILSTSNETLEISRHI